MGTILMIGLATLVWILLAILFSLFLGRVNRLNRAPALTVGRAPARPGGKPISNAAGEAMAAFPARPTRFIGRTDVIVTASSALAFVSGRTAVLFHGIAGVGKTTCAVELAYRHRHAFRTFFFWSASTDPEQPDDALRALTMELQEQLPDHRLLTAGKIVTDADVERLATVFIDAGMLLVLDNLETLLTPDGQWRNPHWALLISALTNHDGPSRVILTSQVMPAGLNADAVLIRPVHALSLEESQLLVGELPTLRPLMDSVALTRCLLTLVQGHPQLLEFADAAATDPPRLAYQLAEIEAALNGTAPLAAFVTCGHTRLDAEQLLQIVTTWTITVAATVPAPGRLMLQALCRMAEDDRNPDIVSANWPALWRRLAQPSEPPSVASTVAPLLSAGLVGVDDLHYRIHAGVTRAIQAATPEPVSAAIDEQLAAWWTSVMSGREVRPSHDGEDSHHRTVRASLAAARYLLRQHHWDAASCLLERALIKDGYSPATCLTVISFLRRIALATGAVKDLVVLGAALRKVDAHEAETVLHHAYHLAATDGNHQIASTCAGELVTLLRDEGRLHDALAMATQKIEHTGQAGFGSWTRLSDQGRRLQILNLLGHHEQVLLDLPTLRSRMADLPDERAYNDRVNSWNVREGVLDIGRLSAVALQRWNDALDLNDEIASTKRRRGASPQEVAGCQFNDYLPLLHLGRLAEADQLLRDCHDVFVTARDVTRLAKVYCARAEIENKRDDPEKAVDLQRTSLHLWYLNPDPWEIATAHHNLADYLSRTAGDPAEQRAHRLAAALLNYLSSNTRGLARSLATLAAEVHGETSCRGKLARPVTLLEVIRLIEVDNGISFRNVVVAVCPDAATAERALAALLSSAGCQM